MKAIETRYNGCKFRSRLEARWATFFDALGIEWQYEPEGFELPSGVKYLPDFQLPNLSGMPCFVEVKPSTEIPEEKRDALWEFGLAIANGPSDGAFLVVKGDPMVLDGFIYARIHGESKCGELSGHTLLSFWISASRKPFEAVKKAAESARVARFEHGERGL